MNKYMKYAPEFIYGSVDGVITTFAIVAASVGAGLSSGVILVLGIANVIADGFSMGSSAYLSSQSDSTDKKEPLHVALATFGAFLIAGMAPLVVYLYDVVVGNASDTNTSLFYVSIAMTLVAFIAIGYGKARVESKKLLVPIATTVGLGVVAAALAYFAGEWLAQLLGVGL